jgi:hypothetical protein
VQSRVKHAISQGLSPLLSVIALSWVEWTGLEFTRLRPFDAHPEQSLALMLTGSAPCMSIGKLYLKPLAP